MVAGLSVLTFVALNATHIIVALCIQSPGKRPPLLTLAIGLTVATLGLVAATWAAVGMFRGKRLGWGLGIVGVYAMSWGLAWVLVIALDITVPLPLAVIQIGIAASLVLSLIVVCGACMKALAARSTVRAADDLTPHNSSGWGR